MIPQFKPFEEGNIWYNMEARSYGETVRDEDAFKLAVFRESADNTSLDDEEKCDIESLLRSLHDIPRWRSCFLSPDSLGDTVLLSEERKTYLDLFVERRLLPERKEDWDRDVVKEIQAMSVLGEYDKGEIILYINNIKDAAEEEKVPGFYGFPYLTVLRYVYLHELMHAFFDRNDGHEYIQEMEEGFAEFGALCLLKKLVDYNPNPRERDVLNHADNAELDWALRHVENKKGALACYARGADLFRQFGNDPDLCGKMLEEYPSRVEPGY